MSEATGGAGGAGGEGGAWGVGGAGGGGVLPRNQNLMITRVHSVH